MKTPHLVPAAPTLRATGLGMLTLALLTAGLVVVVFDWPVVEVILGAVVGGAFWAALTYFTEVRRQVPQSERLPPSPEGVPVGHRRPPKPWLLVAVPGLCLLAWLADRWDVGAWLVPGQFVGYGGAHLAGAVLVARWERAHGEQVLVWGGSGDPELYAAR